MRYIVGLLLGIGLIVLTFILIFRAFSGGSNTPAQQAINLSDYATTNAVMRYTIDGAVTAEQNHNRIRISVSKDTVMFEQIQGYEGKLVQTKTYANNVQAYSTFLRALQLQNFTAGDKTVDDDERGYCPSGNRYVVEALDGGDTILRWWNTSCSNKIGSFRGNSSNIRNIFTRQVPDYNKLVQGVRLSV